MLIYDYIWLQLDYMITIRLYNYIVTYAYLWLHMITIRLYDYN